MGEATATVIIPARDANAGAARTAAARSAAGAYAAYGMARNREQDKHHRTGADEAR